MGNWCFKDGTISFQEIFHLYRKHGSGGQIQKTLQNIPQLQQFNMRQIGTCLDTGSYGSVVKVEIVCAEKLVELINPGNQGIQCMVGMFYNECRLLDFVNTTERLKGSQISCIHPVRSAIANQQLILQATRMMQAKWSSHRGGQQFKFIVVGTHCNKVKEELILMFENELVYHSHSYILSLVNSQIPNSENEEVFEEIQQPPEVLRDIDHHDKATTVIKVTQKQTGEGRGRLN